MKKYEELYQEIEKLKPEDTLQLVLEAETEEQREFYELVGDFCFKNGRERQSKETCFKKYILIEEC